MAAVRKDKKGRILKNGENQLKDGRYMYKYVDETGKEKYVYSWKLVATDITPKGKRKGISLREKEEQIHDSLKAGISSNGGNLTVLQLVEKYLSQKIGVKHNTKANYKFVINLIKKEAFGGIRIDKVKISDAKAWLIKLQRDGRGYSTIHAVRGVVRPAFQLAVDDDLIAKNPFSFGLSTVVINDSVTRKPVTKTQEDAFLDFVKNDSHFSKYYEGIFILFNTGLRISEFVGLTTSDIDLEKGEINVNKQLQRMRNMKYVIETTKTNSGTRIIPMTNEVKECFRKIIKNRKKVKVEPMIDGRTGFLYLDKNDMPMVALHWEKYFQHICEKYKKIHKGQMLKITPHVCRHTFCSKMAKAGMSPKTLQTIMGHSEIGVTFNVYTHLDLEDIKEEMKRVCEK